MKAIHISLIALLLVAAGCKTSEEKQAEEDLEAIENYIYEHNLDAVEKEQGLFIVIDSAGTGTSPTLNDNVVLHYKGMLTSGEMFDESGNEPADFPLASLIEGWQIGLPYFKEGGGGILIIPSALGYGSQKVGNIPANSVLVFEIELIEVY